MSDLKCLESSELREFALKHLKPQPDPPYQILEDPIIKAFTSQEVLSQDLLSLGKLPHILSQSQHGSQDLFISSQHSVARLLKQSFSQDSNHFFRKDN